VNGHCTLMSELGGVAGCPDHCEVGRGEKGTRCCFCCHLSVAVDFVRRIYETGQMDVVLSRVQLQVELRVSRGTG
jgi:hypothetical protein